MGPCRGPIGGSHAGPKHSFNLFSRMTALDDMTTVPIKAPGRPRPDAVPNARRLVSFVGSGEKEGAYPMELSGGQRRRAAIARAPATHPSLTLFDEPTSALDPEMAVEALQVMLDLAAKGPRC